MHIGKREEKKFILIIAASHYFESVLHSDVHLSLSIILLRDLMMHNSEMNAASRILALTLYFFFIISLSLFFGLFLGNFVSSTLYIIFRFGLKMVPNQFFFCEDILRQE